MLNTKKYKTKVWLHRYRMFTDYKPQTCISLWNKL